MNTSVTAALAAGTLAVMASGVATAAAGSSSSVVRGCADHSHNLVLATHGKCPAHTSAVTLGARGPKGARGTRGAQGKQGLQGLQGRPGPGATGSSVETTGTTAKGGAAADFGSSGLSVSAVCSTGTNEAVLNFVSSDTSSVFDLDIGVVGDGVLVGGAEGSPFTLAGGSARDVASQPPPSGTVGGQDEIGLYQESSGQSVVTGLVSVGGADYAITAYLAEFASQPKCEAHIVVTPTS